MSDPRYHDVTAADGKDGARVTLDGVPVRGLLGYEVRRDHDEVNPEVVIRIRANSLNAPAPKVGDGVFALHQIRAMENMVILTPTAEERIAAALSRAEENERKTAETAKQIAAALEKLVFPTASRFV